MSAIGLTAALAFGGFILAILALCAVVECVRMRADRDVKVAALELEREKARHP